VADAAGYAAELARSWLLQPGVAAAAFEAQEPDVITLHVRMSTYEGSTWDLILADVDRLSRQLQAANASETLELEVEFENEDGPQWIA
jgi:hypothetical protein